MVVSHACVRPNTWSESLRNYEEDVMLRYALAFFVVAIIAAVFGFSGIATGAAGIARMLFIIFIAVAAATFLISLSRRA
jgi:uncharacterized membrane protein YtjA (UPF0391 family)